MFMRVNINKGEGGERKGIQRGRAIGKREKRERRDECELMIHSQ